MTKILLVFSSAATTVTGKSAGWYLPEAAHVGVFGPVLSTPESEVRGDLALLFVCSSWFRRRFRFTRGS